jgi:hypothetical protein
MFAKAYEIASNYTYPIVILNRSLNKNVTAGVGTFIILNEDGWFMTAAHIFDIYFKHQEHQREIQQYYANLMAIDTDFSLLESEKELRKSEVFYDPNWMTHHSFWWGFDGLQCETFHLLKENDLAIGKFSNFNINIVSKYPVFKDPTNLKLATSLCKLGFPFHEIKASFDEKLNQFQIAEGVLPIPRFPIDGIFTRVAHGKKSPENEFEVKFIETSTPGLKGQSGGPIFDVEGNIWAIQSMTVNIPLGFSPKVIENGIETIENQFLNVGFGVHVETLCAFMNKHNVKYFMRK